MAGAPARRALERINMNQTPPSMRLAAPTPGENNVAILVLLGDDATAVAAMRNGGVI